MFGAMLAKPLRGVYTPASVTPMNTATIQRAEARTAGTHFIAVSEDHECEATCYRVSDRDGAIYTMCDAGHIVSRRVDGPNLAGSAFAASLNYLPYGAPFVIAEAAAPALAA